MGHHGVVDQGDADPLVQLEADRLDQLRELAAVEAPHEPFHVAGQVDFHRARRRTHILVRFKRAQIGIDQHPVIDVFQPLRTIAQAVGRSRRDGVHADAYRHVGRSVVRVAHAHGAVVHRRGGGGPGGSAPCCPMSRVIHPGHGAVIHAAHPHVGHGQVRHLAERRNLRRHAQARRQRRAAHARAVDGFGDDGVGPVLGRTDDDVIGLGHRDLELVHLDRPDVLAVGLHHGHGQARDADVEDRHRRGVDDAQAHSLAGPEQAGPVLLRAVAVDQIGIGRAVDVQDVARVHPHPAPHPPLGQAHPVRAVQQARQCGLLMIEVAGALLQLGQDLVRMKEAPVRQDQDVLAVITDRIDARRVDDDGTIMADRFLQARMAVIPVGARLLQRELIDEGLARLDAGEADPRHPVHLERQQQAVPVDRRVLVQRVGHRQAHVLALAHPQQGRGQEAVDRHCVAGAPADGEVGTAHRQVDVRPGQRRQIGAQTR
ncbi:hypothetical protein D3C77_313900 [compost metagenome]